MYMYIPMYVCMSVYNIWMRVMLMGFEVFSINRCVIMDALKNFG